MHHGSGCDRLGVGHHALRRTARRAQLVGSRPRTGDFVRGRGYHRTQRLNEAAEDYRAAFALDPKNAEILVSWSNVDVRLRRMDDYKTRVEQAYALNPRNARVLRSVGALLSDRGESDKAFEFYSKAIEVDPTEGFALYFRARQYRFRRQFAEAIADASALLAIPPARLNDAQGFLDEDGIVRDFRVKALLERAYSYEDFGRLDLAEKTTTRRSTPDVRRLRSPHGRISSASTSSARTTRCATSPRRCTRSRGTPRFSMRSAFHLRDSSALRRLSRPSMPP